MPTALLSPVRSPVTPKGHLHLPRSAASVASAHTASLLPDGRVLVAGGEPITGGCEVSLASAEIYNPATGTWTQTAGIGPARSQPTLTLLGNGRVLLAGGRDSVDFGQYSGCFFNPLTDTRVFDPATGQWSATGSLGNARGGHTATRLVDGRVLVTAGTSGDFGSPGTAEIYDPSTGTWSTTGNMTRLRFGHAATRLPDGRVLVTGGGWVDESAAEIYDPATGGWTLTASMATERTYHTATPLANGTVLVVGTQSAGDQPSTEIFTP